MKKDPGLVFRLFLILSDVSAIVLSFVFAYYFRVHIDPNPYTFVPNTMEFIMFIVFLVPLWIIILAALGLYRKNIILGKHRLKEIGLLVLASIIGTMSIITIDFFNNSEKMPARSIAAYSIVACLVSLLLFRFIVRIIRRLIVRKDYGIINVVIVGNHYNTRHLIDYISTTPESGYRIVGVVAGKSFIPSYARTKQFSSLKEVLRHVTPDAIFQTDERQREYVYKQSIHHHISYHFVPSSASLSSHTGELELIGNVPTILVKVTPLLGGARIVKRFFDILFSFIGLVIAAIPMFVIWLIVKISDPSHSAFYKENRLSRFNKTFKIYKFRSMRPEYSGMSPEDAFKKMGKPELIRKYRKNGDYLANDPRITKIGRFLRKTSLDELPQLFNVLKGDISLVGPRALVPGELRNYGDRSLLLSVKSGLTGLAQVSGRRDIPFDERRALDIYYIQNWSLLLDMQILFKTVGAVLKHKGAK